MEPTADDILRRIDERGLAWLAMICGKYSQLYALGNYGPEPSISQCVRLAILERK